MYAICPSQRGMDDHGGITGRIAFDLPSSSNRQVIEKDESAR